MLPFHPPVSLLFEIIPHLTTTFTSCCQVYFPGMTADLPSRTSDFRTVLHTGLYSQIVLMTVPVGGEIGEEVHAVDQTLVFTSGLGKAIVGGEEQEVKATDMVVVPAGTRHNFVNSGEVPLSLFTGTFTSDRCPFSNGRF